MAKRDRENVQSGLEDILGNVIRTDRRNSGRKEAPEEAPPPETEPQREPDPEPETASPETEAEPEPEPRPDRAAAVRSGVLPITHSDNKAITQYDNNTSVTTKDVNGGEDEHALRERRWNEALALADTPTTTVTLRVPHAFNDWLDAYLHGAWPEKFKKQDLLIEALQLLYVRRGGPKEPVLETDLLPGTGRSGGTAAPARKNRGRR